MVEKGDLMKVVWPDTFVEEGALTRNISLLRKTLGDTGEEPAYIETIPKRGYRFVAPVVVVEGRSNHTAPIAPEITKHIETLAVRPSRNSAILWLTVAAMLAVAGLAVASYLIRVRSIPSVASVTAPDAVVAVLPFRSFKSDPSQDYFAEGIT